MKNKTLIQRILSVVFLVFLAVGTVLILRKSNTGRWQEDSGPVFGTFYSVKYQSPKRFDKEIREVLAGVDASFSIFNDSSTVSRLNHGDSTFSDTLFTYALVWATHIARETRGAFDFTVGPLVNAWGFGFKSGTFPTESQVDSLREFVGYEKLYWEHSRERGGLIRRSDPRMMMDFGAIAKGYGVDCVARLLESKGVGNYMVMIGGEVVVRGQNPEGNPWTIGVEEPVDSRDSIASTYNKILSLTNCAVATSGNYHNYFYHNGKKISHTIDPRTGYPATTSMLSATVIASTCMQADAYATSFMVMGPDSARAFLAKHSDLRAYFIYEEDGQRRTWQSKGL